LSILARYTAPSIPLADRIASDFTEFLNAWHASPEVYDDALDAQIHKWYYDILTDKARKVWAPRNMPYFSPSSTGSDPRELYEKLRKAKKDTELTPPHQGRWKRIGTTIGDIIQRDILFAEKHFEKAIGVKPRFNIERNERNEPVFEDFAKMSHVITHNGKTFALFGTGDGIMHYVADDGEMIRVGLEVKSKQTSSAKTSDFSQRNGPEEDHVKQCVVYSLMYNVDYYVILYVNASKKGWVMSPEDFAKTPDIRVHGIYITDDMRNEVLDLFAGILHAVDTGTPPPLDPDNFTFNKFKQACALSLSDEELADIQRQVSALQRSNLPDYKKRGPAEALAEIERIRAEVVAVE